MPVLGSWLCIVQQLSLGRAVSMHTAQPLPCHRADPILGGRAWADRVILETFLCLCAKEGGESQEQRRVRRKAGGEGSLPHALLKALRGRLHTLHSGWCAIQRTTFIGFIHWIAEGQIWHLTAASMCSCLLVPRVSVPGLLFCFEQIADKLQGRISVKNYAISVLFYISSCQLFLHRIEV